jgi:ribosomal protein S18
MFQPGQTYSPQVGPHALAKAAGGPGPLLAGAQPGHHPSPAQLVRAATPPPPLPPPHTRPLDAPPAPLPPPTPLPPPPRHPQDLNPFAPKQYVPRAQKRVPPRIASNEDAHQFGDFKNVDFLSRFVTDAGRLKARRATRLRPAVHYRLMKQVGGEIGESVGPKGWGWGLDRASCRARAASAVGAAAPAHFTRSGAAGYAG